MIRKSALRAASVLALSVVLAGCSSGPSESDVRRAVEAELEAMNQQVVAMVGQAAANRVGSNRLTGFDLLGCEGSDETYRCDVVVSMDTPLMPVTDRALTLRVRKADGGWKVMEGLQ